VDDGGRTRYFVLRNPFSGRLITVIRYYYERGVEVRFDAWRRGHWEEADHYANIVLLGDTRADEVSEEEAFAMIEQLPRQHR
jgi:hypothetical protein